MDTTRSLFVFDSTLGGWPGVGVYLYDADAGTLTAVTSFPFADAPLNFYEVSALPGQGSYWLPTASQDAMPASWAQDAYGGFEALEAVGAAIWTAAAGQATVRPSGIYFWVPESTLASAPNVPGICAGSIVDSPPQTSPRAPTDEPAITVEKIDGGMRITLHPPESTARVQGNVVHVTFPSRG